MTRHDTNGAGDPRGLASGAVRHHIERRHSAKMRDGLLDGPRSVIPLAPAAQPSSADARPSADEHPIHPALLNLMTDCRSRRLLRQYTELAPDGGIFGAISTVGRIAMRGAGTRISVGEPRRTAAKAVGERFCTPDRSGSVAHPRPSRSR